MGLSVFYLEEPLSFAFFSNMLAAEDEAQA
jgi:hypothetical protein